MIVAVASGKGGTGKTTVAASLVRVWEGLQAAVDLDVEEPNLHLFLRPEMKSSQSAYMDVPVIDEEKCTLCGACVEICQFKAISKLGDKLLTFPEMCHACGGCKAVCPADAVSWGRRELGTVEAGSAFGAHFLMGRLRVGEAMSPPLMRSVKERLAETFGENQGDAIIDAPPGVSCPAMQAVMDADVLVLVTEPTPFGLHDFRLAWEAFSPLGKPMGAVVNRAGIGNDDVLKFCREKDLPVLAQIPFSRAVAEGYSQGRIIADLDEQHRSMFLDLRSAIQSLSTHSEVAHA